MKTQSVLDRLSEMNTPVGPYTTCRLLAAGIAACWAVLVPVEPAAGASDKGAAAPPIEIVQPRAGTGAEPSPPFQVTLSDGFLDVTAEKADLRALLLRISELTRVPILVDPAIETTVTAQFTRFPVEKAVERLLRVAGQENLAMEFSRRPGAGRDELAIDRITVVRGTPKAGRTEAEIAAGIRQREQELQDYFAKMDNGKGKIARALKKQLDPQTSPEEKLKLKTYLRQTPVDDLEDKQFLKDALMDTRFQGGVVSDMQMALLHAMQDHPEEKDKDYIVALLARKDNRVGWLYYAMLKVWDERYVPYLVEAVVKEEGLVDFEILGRMGVKTAIPFLEVALKSKRPEIRQSAHDALYHLTGKKYPIEW